MDCRWGDARLAACLLKYNIPLSDLKVPGLFNESPPNTLTKWWPSDPCIKPITFHHLLPFQTLTLYSIEMQLKNKTLTNYGHVFQKMLNIDNIYAKNKDRKDSDFLNFNVTERTGSLNINFQLSYCRNECYDNINCFSFVLSTGICWLKNDIPEQIDAAGIYSGILYEKYFCKN